MGQWRKKNHMCDKQRHILYEPIWYDWWYDVILFMSHNFQEPWFFEGFTLFCNCCEYYVAAGNFTTSSAPAKSPILCPANAIRVVCTTTKTPKFRLVHWSNWSCFQGWFFKSSLLPHETYAIYTNNWNHTKHQIVESISANWHHNFITICMWPICF